MQELKKFIKALIDKTGWLVRRWEGVRAGYDLLWDLRRWRLMPDAPVILDVGAHVGETSSVFATVFPNAKILAFEPVRENFEALRKNTQPYRNVSSFHCALGDENKKIKIALHKTSQKHSLRNVANPYTERAELIEVRTLDSLLRDGVISVVDLLKIDAEGYELQILDGAKETLTSGKVRLIFVEATLIPDSEYHTYLFDLQNRLAPYGFRPISVYDQNVFHNPFCIGYLNALFAKSDSVAPYVKDEHFH